MNHRVHLRLFPDNHALSGARKNTGLLSTPKLERGRISLKEEKGGPERMARGLYPFYSFAVLQISSSWCSSQGPPSEAPTYSLPLHLAADHQSGHPHAPFAQASLHPTPLPLPTLSFICLASLCSPFKTHFPFLREASDSFHREVLASVSPQYLTHTHTHTQISLVAIYIYWENVSLACVTGL